MEFLHLVSILVSFLMRVASRMLQKQANVLTITGRYRGSSIVSLTRSTVANS
jgi:hypothetical protein